MQNRVNFIVFIRAKIRVFSRFYQIWHKIYPKNSVSLTLQSESNDGEKSIKSVSSMSSVWDKSYVMWIVKSRTKQHKKIHTLGVYSVKIFPKFKYTIQRPSSNPLPTSKIPTHSVCCFYRDIAIFANDICKIERFHTLHI